MKILLQPHHSNSHTIHLWLVVVTQYSHFPNWFSLSPISTSMSDSSSESTSASNKILWKSRIFLGDGQSNRRRQNWSRGSGGMLPRKILKIAVKIKPLYSIWARILYFFLAENWHVKRIKDLLYICFPLCVINLHCLTLYLQKYNYVQSNYLLLLCLLMLVQGTNSSDLIVCYSNFQSLQMFVSDTVMHQIFAFICKADRVFTPHAVPGMSIVFDRSNFSEGMLKAFICPFPNAIAAVL